MGNLRAFDISIGLTDFVVKTNRGACCLSTPSEPRNVI